MTIPELLYYTGYNFKKKRDIKKQRRLPEKVISIGNLTVGGTGKTPAVITIAERAKDRGYFPVILTRGYKGRRKGPLFVSKGDGPLLSPVDVGDEAFLIARRLSGVPVIKAEDRFEGGCLALENYADHERMIFILDDGYQHWRLFRDMDILLVDALNPFGNRRLLPVGRLREPLREMQRADIIIITRSATQPEPLIEEIKRYNENAPVFISDYRPSHLMTCDGERIPLSELIGKKVIGFCAIGNPLSFRRSITDIGIELRDFITFRDHHRYLRHDIERIKRTAERIKADWIITTEKDIIKVPEHGNLPLLYLCSDFWIEEGFFEIFFRRLDDKVH